MNRKCPGYIRSVLDRLDRLGWPTWRQQRAYERMVRRRGVTEGYQ